MIEKIMVLFKHHLKSVHEIEFYDYQLEIAENIFKALIQNIRLSSNATEEDIKKLNLVELAVEISRQAGKTTAIVHTIEFIMIYFPHPNAFGKKVEINLFAPQREQAKTDFDRLKAALAKTTEFQVIYDEQEQEKAREESNARTITLPNGASCYIFPVTSTSKPESKSPDLMLFEESQDMDDLIVQQQIWPMGAAKNAPRIYIGTAGTKICYFYRLGQTDKALKLYFDEVSTQRRMKFEETSNALHLMYERTITQDIEKQGIDSDEIQRPYFGKWLIGSGQFATQEMLDVLETSRGLTQHEKENECYAGIDTAKINDSTIVTIVRKLKNPVAIERIINGKPEQKIVTKELINWMELRGDNYQNQFEIIHDFLKHYNVVAVAIDATGQGEFMPDMFENNTEWADERSGLYRVKFSMQSKSIMYKNLKVVIHELLTTLPKLDTKKTEKFKMQMLDLQQEYKGEFLSVHHPDGDYHDDYPDSWALAEFAYSQYNKDNFADITFIDKEPQKSVAIYKEERAGREVVVDHWPGLD